MLRNRVEEIVRLGNVDYQFKYNNTILKYLESLYVETDSDKLKQLGREIEESS